MDTANASSAAVAGIADSWYPSPDDAINFVKKSNRAMKQNLPQRGEAQLHHIIVTLI